MAQDLEISVRADAFGVIVALDGELDSSNVTDLERVVTGALADLAGAGRATVDLASLDFCDSSGIYVLIRLEKLARDCGASLVLARPQGMVARLFEVANLGQSVEIV